LTGGIASGKSSVSTTLAQLGAIIIDGDEIAHHLIEPHQPAWEEIVKVFGEDILLPDESINRATLGAIVFNDPEQLLLLDRITHPRVIAQVEEELRRVKSIQPEAMVVLEIPLLYEVNMDRLCDQVWVVWVDRETQINRLMTRNGFSRDEALQRIDSQMPLDEKAQRADVIIDNRGKLEETIRLATRYFNDILTKP